MGFHRLYWVPDGMPASDGVYVRYPADELFAVLAVEASRRGARIVGEDLGTVPDEVRDALDRYGILGMYVSQFQLPDGARHRLPLPNRHQVASLDTHDTPTVRGVVAGRRHRPAPTARAARRGRGGRRHPPPRRASGSPSSRPSGTPGALARRGR